MTSDNSVDIANITTTIIKSGSLTITMETNDIIATTVEH